MSPFSITLITICFNNLEELKTTCQSIDIQSMPPFEHLIIDGSTNNDINNWLINTPQAPYRKWIYERDKGISDAMNKGVLNAKGEIIVMLNSADCLYDTTIIEDVTQTFKQHTHLQWMHAKSVFYRGDVWIQKGTPFDKHLLYRGMRNVSHQTMFYKKSLHDKYGLYDLDCKVAMDYDFLVRISDEPMLYKDKIYIKFAPGGTSHIHFKKGLQDVKRSFFKYKGFSLKLILWQWRIILLHYFTYSFIGKIWFRYKNKKNMVK